MFLPIIIMIIGGIIWVVGGVNDVPNTSNIFQALGEIPPFYFWSGLIVTLAGPALVVYRNFRI